MQLRIVRETAYLRAELRARETPEQMREALTTLLSECRRSGMRRVLLSTRASRPLFKVQQFGLTSFLDGMGAACRLALVSDNPELRAADEYVATMAQQRGVEVRTFRSEAAAAHWLQGGLQHAPSSGRRYRFNRIVIAGAPSEPGVYTLWQGEEVIYYGRAQGGATIRSRLLEHLEQPVGATHYSWEISREPAPLEKELLQQFKRAFGRLPRLNEAA